MVRHVGLVLLSFVVLQMMRRSAEESVGSVKERWQLEVLRDGESPPPLLKAVHLIYRPPRKSCYIREVLVPSRMIEQPMPALQADALAPIGGGSNSG